MSTNFPDESLPPDEFASDLAQETANGMKAEDLEQAREIFSMSVSGQSQAEIGAILGLSRATIARRLTAYRANYRLELESAPRPHLIAEQLMRYQKIADDSLRDAENCDSDRARSAHRSVAIKSLQCYDALCLASGAFPREPDRAFIISSNLSTDSDKPDHEKSPEELRADILQLLKYGKCLR